MGETGYGTVFGEVDVDRFSRHSGCVFGSSQM